jgi:hypothetical protein
MGFRIASGTEMTLGIVSSKSYVDLAARNVPGFLAVVSSLS